MGVLQDKAAALAVGEWVKRGQQGKHVPVLMVMMGHFMRFIVSKTAHAGLPKAPGTLKYRVMGSVVLCPFSHTSDAISWLHASSSRNRPTKSVRVRPNAL